MQPKSLIRLGLIFLSLVAAVVLVRFWTKPKGPFSPYKTLDENTLSSITLRQIDGQTLQLQKIGTQWRLSAPVETEADSHMVAKLLSGLKALEIQEVISENPEKYSYYQVEEASGTRVLVSPVTKSEESVPVVDLLVGKTAGDFSHSYVRFPGKKEIHLSQGLSGSLINQSLTSWRDRSFIDVPRESAQAISIEWGKKKFELIKSSESWTSHGQTVPPTVMTPLLNLMTPLDADDFAQSTETFKSAGLQPPAFSYAITSGSDTVKVSFGKTINGKTFASREGSPTLYLLYDYKVNQIIDKLKEIK